MCYILRAPPFRNSLHANSLLIQSHYLLAYILIPNCYQRIVTKSEFDTPAMELIHNLNWPTVSDIIRSETATTMCRSLNVLVPEYLSNLFVKNSTRNVRELRNTETDLSLPLRKTKNGQNAISCRGPKLWDQLELDLKQAPSLATFKKRLKN